MSIEDEGTRQRARMDIVGRTRPAKLFAQVTLTVDIWVDPKVAGASMDMVADNVAISMKNAVDAVAKEIDCPDQGIEVLVK